MAQTVAASNYGSFTVGGSSSSYYAVQFVNNVTTYGAPNGSNTSDLVIYRSNTHEDGAWYGTFNLVISFHPTDWGHFGGQVEKVIYQTGSGSPYNEPVGDLTDGSGQSGGNDLIVWLKGGATYHWRNRETTAGWSLANGNSTGQSIVDSSNMTRSPISSQSTLVLNSKNTFFVNSLGIGTGNNLSVYGLLAVQGGANFGNNQIKVGYSGISSFGGLNAGQPLFFSNGGDGGDNQFFYDIYQNYEGLNIGVVNFGGSSYGGVSPGAFSTLFKVDGHGGVYTGRPQNTPNSANSNPNITISNTLDDGAGNAVFSGTVSASSGVIYPDGSKQITAWTGVLCGGDYAESVDVAGGKKQYEPGDVLVLTSDHENDVQKSAEPYSTMVAGIYATKPGVIGRRESLPKTADELPMAMVGIVPTKVTTENGPIRKGDLLVTSSLPGHAMKGTDRTRMLGAVIGKAMDSLDSGTGMIEVLVTLQ